MEGAVQAPSFDAALEQVATAAALGNVEKDDFCDWLLHMELWPDEESLHDWRGSAAYERTKHERIAAFVACMETGKPCSRISSSSRIVRAHFTHASAGQPSVTSAESSPSSHSASRRT